MGNMEFDFVRGRSRKELVRSLERRGMDELEAEATAEILLNAERYQSDKFKVKAGLSLMRELLEEGEFRMGLSDDPPGIFYGVLKVKLRELEDLAARKGF